MLKSSAESTHLEEQSHSQIDFDVFATKSHHLPLLLPLTQLLPHQTLQPPLHRFHLHLQSLSPSKRRLPSSRRSFIQRNPPLHPQPPQLLPLRVSIEVDLSPSTTVNPQSTSSTTSTRMMSSTSFPSPPSKQSTTEGSAQCKDARMLLMKESWERKASPTSSTSTSSLSPLLPVFVQNSSVILALHPLSSCQMKTSLPISSSSLIQAIVLSTSAAFWGGWSQLDGWV